MLPFIKRHRKATLIGSSLSAALLISTLVWAVPGGNTGQWVLRDNFECVDTSLYCVVWEFSPGETTAEPCCVTAANFAFNVPSCSNYDVMQTGE